MPVKTGYLKRLSVANPVNWFNQICSLKNVNRIAISANAMRVAKGEQACIPKII